MSNFSILALKGHEPPWCRHAITINYSHMGHLQVMFTTSQFSIRQQQKHSALSKYIRKTLNNNNYYYCLKNNISREMPTWEIRELWKYVWSTIYIKTSLCDNLQGITKLTVLLPTEYGKKSCVETTWKHISACEQGNVFQFFSVNIGTTKERHDLKPIVRTILLVNWWKILSNSLSAGRLLKLWLPLIN